MRVVEGESSAVVSLLAQEIHWQGAHVERDLDDHEDVLSRLETLVDLVMERARTLGYPADWVR